MKYKVLAHHILQNKIYLTTNTETYRILETLMNILRKHFVQTNRCSSYGTEDNVKSFEATRDQLSPPKQHQRRHFHVTPNFF